VAAAAAALATEEADAVAASEAAAGAAAVSEAAAPLESKEAPTARGKGGAGDDCAPTAEEHEASAARKTSRAKALADKDRVNVSEKIR